MTRPDPLAVAARALAHVLDLTAADVRADSPLHDLGADSIARIQWADVAEDLWAPGVPPVIDDESLAAARTVGDLAALLAPGPRGGRG